MQGGGRGAGGALTRISAANAADAVPKRARAEITMFFMIPTPRTRFGAVIHHEYQPKAVSEKSHCALKCRCVVWSTRQKASGRKPRGFGVTPRHLWYFRPMPPRIRRPETRFCFVGV